ncbi:hypothetical protein [Gorillibacterium massiliense]|uniref:hypothetical protein n=1 Tax=Gorillibacterium massiliense TaxID=1280390 RepID=UPI0004B54685|nr:hypothetical protein [Gorillibacterium massiliense]
MTNNVEAVILARKSYCKIVLKWNEQHKHPQEAPNSLTVMLVGSLLGLFLFSVRLPPTLTDANTKEYSDIRRSAIMERAVERTVANLYFQEELFTGDRGTLYLRLERSSGLFKSHIFTHSR